MKRIFYLNGLNCAHCAGVIEKKLISNYKDVEFSFATKKLILESDKKTNSLKEEIQMLVNDIEDGVSVDLPEEEKKENNSIKKYYKEIIGIILAFSMIVLPISNKVPFFVVAYLLVGGDILKRAIKNIFKGKVFDENFLMTIATIGAIAIGEYMEAVMVMTFYKVGEAFQDRAVDNSRKNIMGLLDLKSSYGNLYKNGNIEKIKPEEIKIEDILVIKAGEKIPVDGVVIEGKTVVDTKAITGESLPRKINLGDEILSGYINQNTTIKIRATKKYKDSTIYRIFEMVENATANKAKTEKFITKFAKVYTPIVVILALALAFLPTILGYGTFDIWLKRSLIFLVISCPCALVLSVPLGYFAGIGNASKNGVLIKGGNFLEALNDVDTYVFDKTGTLTKGNFAVVDYNDDKTLEYAYLLEKHTNHPIGNSIVKTYESKLTTKKEAKNVEEIVGLGIKGYVNKELVLVGNKRLMEENKINIKEQEFSGATVYVAIANKYIGHINIEDEIKENAKSAINDLKNKKSDNIYMLTGDVEKVAKNVGQKLGINNIYSKLLPSNKLQKVKNLKASGKNVLFVGDGINDAPVLAEANVGVAMGGVGSDIAIESADIVLMTDDISKIMVAKKIAKKTKTIILQNIIFALLVKITFLILGAFGMANMYEAIFSDVGVALLCILNSMRILKK